MIFSNIYDLEIRNLRESRKPTDSFTTYYYCYLWSSRNLMKPRYYGDMRVRVFLCTQLRQSRWGWALLFTQLRHSRLWCEGERGCGVSASAVDLVYTINVRYASGLHDSCNCCVVHGLPKLKLELTSSMGSFLVKSVWVLNVSMIVDHPFFVGKEFNCTQFTFCRHQ